MSFKKITLLIILFPIFIYSSDRIIFGDNVEVVAENPFLATNLFKVIKLNNKAMGADVDIENNYSVPGMNNEDFSICMDIFKKDAKNLNEIARLYVLYDSIPYPNDINETRDIFSSSGNKITYELTEDDKKLVDNFNEEKNDISKNLLDVLEKSSSEEIIKLYKAPFFPIGDNFLSSLLLFSLKDNANHIENYLIKNAIKIKNYTQSSTKQYLWQGCLQDKDVLIYDLFNGQERDLNYFFTGQNAEILNQYSADTLFDIIDENTFVFFKPENKQLDFVYYRDNKISSFSCTSLRENNSSVRSFIKYGTSYYYVKYEDNDYVVFYDQEKDGFIFILFYMGIKLKPYFSKTNHG